MRKRKGARLTDKQLLIIALSLTIILGIALILIVFKDSIFKEKAEDVNWGEIEETGEISIDETEPEPEPVDITTDEHGIEYERKKLYNMGISLYLPKNWNTITTNPDVVYLEPNNDDNLTGIDICITTNMLGTRNPVDYGKDMYYFIRDNLRYHNGGYELHPVVYERDTVDKYVVSDPNHLVYVDVNNLYDYVEYDSLDGAPNGNYEQRAKALGVTENGTLSLTSDTQRVKADVHYDFFYTIRNDTLCFLSVMCPTGKQTLGNEIMAFISNSIEEIDPSEGIALPRLDKTLKLGDMTLKYPEKWVKTYNGEECQRFESYEINSDDLGVGVTVFRINFMDESLVETDLSTITSYKQTLTESCASEDIRDISFSNINEIILAHDEGSPTVIDGKEAIERNVSLSLLTDGTEIDTKLNRTLPINGIMYQIPYGQYVYCVIVTGNQGNQAVIDKIASSISRTITIG